ncbi:MAG: DUF4296 domain-containing protein [Bacteroidetes bacterium]|nr:MAG: DUF4296 domain-containing protein [Bacteroidota bacterium]
MLKVFATAAMLLLFACKAENKVLPVNAMKVVMWDLLQIDEFATLYLAKDTSLNVLDSSKLLYAKVFAFHKLDQKQFFESLTWYRENVEAFKQLTDSVSAYATRQREERFLAPTPMPSNAPVR